MAIHDSRAISPVLGVVLLVGITIALAAVVATLALGATAGLAAPDFAADEDAPSATFETDELRGATELTHAGGDALAGGDLVVVTADGDRIWGEGTVRAGDSLVVAGVVERVEYDGVVLERFDLSGER